MIRAWVCRCWQFLTRVKWKNTGRKSPGTVGEDAAADFLSREQGFDVLERNWRPGRGHGEIDIIARDGPVLVFVEVRARSAKALVSGYYSIRLNKKRVLRRTCLAYIEKLKQVPKTIRFDVISISLNEGQIVDLQYFQNVPLFQKGDG